MAKKNLIKIAKGSVATKPQQDVNDKNELAKKKVAELLNDVKFSVDNDILEIESESQNKNIGDVENTSNIRWFEEQIELLSEENEKLKNELEYLKENNNIVSDNITKNNIIKLFEELQKNYVEMGINQFGQPNFRIIVPGFMNRMILFFPFLEQMKKY